MTAAPQPAAQRHLHSSGASVLYPLIASTLIAVARIALLLAVCRSNALAQATPVDRTTLGSTWSDDLVRDLPTSDNLFQLLETAQPTLITDRFLGGGLYAGQPARVGGFLSSWNQTLYRIDDVSVTDPTSGAPLLFPSLIFWRAVDVSTGILGADVDAVGLAISLEPRRPTATWNRTIEVSTSHFGGSAPSDSAPALVRLDGWDRGSFLAAGPIVPNRLGLVAGGSWTRGSQFERAETVAVVSDVAAAFGHLMFTPTSRDEVRTIGWVQRTTSPFEFRLPFNQPAATVAGTSGHVQSTWQHRGPGQLPLKFLAGYTRRHQSPSFDPSAGAVFERLADGPVAAVANIASNSAYRWSVGGRVGGPTNDAGAGRHTLQADIEADGSGFRAASFYAGEARELVNSLRARIWRFQEAAVPSFRHQLGLAASVSDRVAITPRLSVEAGIRYDSVSGAAEGGATPVKWATLLPRAALRWTAPGPWRPSLFATYSRSAYRLPLDWLAVGDPAAPTGNVFRWEESQASPSNTLVARVGPGSGGNPDFAGIDPDLKRPQADELVLGVEVRPTANLRFRLTGMNRREWDLAGLVNTGGASYTVSGLFDPGGNVGSPEDDRLVPVYNRERASFGLDRYLLTNLNVSDSTLEGVEFSAELNHQRGTIILGGTASRAQTSAANRGFGPLENDQGLIGELGANPNAGTFARGRPFTDRAYTAKVVGVYRFPTSTTLGVVARYQDGQPFSRMLVVPTLNQGPEAVRAFAGGDSRFMFTGTLDARLQQRLGRVDIVIDIYNLPGLSYSVEEMTTEAPDVRVTTAIQPPRTVHVGLRLTF